MDAMYRYQRHIYDLTRKFYLFGRDQLLRQLPAPAGAKILEMGCGTGRNLVNLARRAAGAEIYGVDISREMLATAEAKLARAGLRSHQHVARAGRPGAADVSDESMLVVAEDWDH